MKKCVFIMFAAFIPFLLSCSKSESNTNVSSEIKLSDYKINLNYGKVGNISILEDNHENYQISTDNDFVATCSISGNTIIVTPKHVGNTLATVTNGKDNKTIEISVNSTTENVCGSPVMMFGKPAKEVKDSLNKHANITYDIASTKAEYTEKNSDGYVFTYKYYFNTPEFK